MDHALQDTSVYLRVRACVCVRTPTHLRPQWSTSRGEWQMSLQWPTRNWRAGYYSPDQHSLLLHLYVSYELLCCSDRWLFRSLSPHVSITRVSLWLCGYPGRNKDRFKSLLSLSPGFTSQRNHFLTTSGKAACVCKVCVRVKWRVNATATFWPVWERRH